MNNRIAILRKTAGMSQKELADKLGVVQTTVSSWELGKNMPDNDTLRKIAEIFDVNFGYVAEYSNQLESAKEESEFEQELYKRTGMHLKQLKELQDIAANWLLDIEQEEPLTAEKPNNQKANIFDKTVIATSFYAYLLTLSWDDKQLFFSGKMKLTHFTKSPFFQKLSRDQQFYLYQAYEQGKW